MTVKLNKMFHLRLRFQECIPNLNFSPVSVELGPKFSAGETLDGVNLTIIFFLEHVIFFEHKIVDRETNFQVIGCQGSRLEPSTFFGGLAVSIFDSFFYANCGRVIFGRAFNLFWGTRGVNF